MRHHRVLRADQRMVGDRAVGHARLDEHPALGGGGDRRQAEPPQVDQRIGLLDPALHQVEQVGAAREVLGARRGTGGNGVVDADGVPELEGLHAVGSWATASMAATMLA